MTLLRNDDRGFSLVELLVGIAIMAVLGAAVVGSVIRTLQVSADATVRVDAMTSLQRAHERMTRNIRAADPIGSASSSDLSLTVWDSPNQRRVISYALVGDTVEQTTATFTSPTSSTPSTVGTTVVIDGLAQGVEPLFTYATSDGTSWNGVASEDIASVSITLVAESGNGTTIPLTTSVFIRNSVIS